MRALQEFGLSQVRACAIVGQPRRTMHYRGQPKDDSAIAERTQALAQERPRWGWRRLLIMIRRDGVEVGEVRFRRIYRSLALQVRPRKKRKVRYIRDNVVPAVSRPNERWSIDRTLRSATRLPGSSPSDFKLPNSHSYRLRKMPPQVTKATFTQLTDGSRRIHESCRPRSYTIRRCHPNR